VDFSSRTSQAPEPVELLPGQSAGEYIGHEVIFTGNMNKSVKDP
jgi:hypothetical protein